MDTKIRSWAKAISFRIIATIATVIIVFIITGNLSLASVIGGMDMIIKLFLYYLHERAWGKIIWGKNLIIN